MHQQVPETMYNSNNHTVNTLLTKLFTSMTKPSDISFSYRLQTGWATGGKASLHTDRSTEQKPLCKKNKTWKAFQCTNAQGKSPSPGRACVWGTAGAHWGLVQPLKAEMANTKDTKAPNLTAFLEHKMQWCVKCKSSAFWRRRVLLPWLWTLTGREKKPGKWFLKTKKDSVL